MLAHSLANESFNFGGRHPAHGPDTPRLPVQEGRRKVIAILDPSVAHMAWGHSVAPVVIDAADQYGFGSDRATVWLLRCSLSLACTASKSSRSRMAGCSPGKTSPLNTTSPM